MLFFVPLQHADFQFTPILEIRSRYEQRNDLSFDNSLSQDRTMWVNRGRAGFDLKTDENTTFRVLYQYSNVNIDDTGSAGGIVSINPFYNFSVGTTFRAETRQDLVEGYLQHTDGDATLTVGRQMLSMYPGKLLGDNDWGEVARSWNAARLQTGDWDFFVGQLALDRANNGGVRLGMVSHNWGYGGQTSVIYKSDPAFGDSIYTLDHLYWRQMNNLGIGVEAAYQWGRDGGRDLEAWAGTIYAQLESSNSMTFWGEYDIATGGSAAGAKSHTFDDLYPSDHGHYGLMDLMGWRNMNTFGIGLDWSASNDVEVSLGYYNFTKYDSSDGWYSGRNTIGPYGIPGGGASASDDLGSEVDISLNWQLRSDTKLGLGIAFFDPGTAMTQMGAGSDNQTWFFAQLSWKR
ncbi:MAG: alginate export family protein [Armatimonadetes bacterium]|nr:alginate export family protein [Armatimonadota bacterium]